MTTRPRKKIAWLTPFGPRSDIGAHSLSIVRAMRCRAAEYDCEVVLFVKPNGASYHAGSPRIVMGQNFDPDLLNLYDLTVLNLGNNQENHAIINETALIRGGLVVVHDIVMQHYIAWQTLQRLRIPRRFADVLCNYYGSRAVEMLARSGLTLKDQVTRYLPWDTEYAFEFPLIEPFLERARAVVVHSEFASETLARLTDAPQLKLFLPSDKKTAPSPVASPDGKVRFVSIGHFARSKHLHLCLEAFLLSDVLRERATLRIAGGGNADSDLVRELHEIIREHDLHDIVKLEFNVTEQRIFEIKAAADVFVNVRFPNTESASGSLAEQMACGVPVIVYASGCYREAPDDAVVKIGDLSNSDALRAAMERLVTEPQTRTTIGRTAREFGAHRTADDYAKNFLKFVRDTDLSTPRGAPAASSAARSFPWLQRELEVFDSPRRAAPCIFAPEDRPIYEAIVKLNAETVAQYISLVVFRLSVPPENLEAITAIVAEVEPERRAALVARLAFYNRIFESRAPALLSEFALAADAHPLAVLPRVRPVAFVTLLYLALLGRGPQEREAEMHLPALAQYGSGALMRSFAASPEFAKRGTPRQFAESIAALASALDQLEGRGAERTRLVRRGDRLGPAELAALLAEGWHECESDGVWSSAPTARLRLRLSSGEERPRRLRARLRVLSTPIGEPQGVTVSRDREGLKYTSVADGEPFFLDIPLDPAGGPFLLVSLTVDRPVRLADRDPEGDPRSLGVFLYGLDASGD